MNLSRENKLDALSGLIAVFGIALMFAAVELHTQALMEVGGGVVVLTALLRFWAFRAFRASQRLR